MENYSNHDCEPFNTCTECHREQNMNLITTQGGKGYDIRGKSGTKYPLIRKFFWLVIKHDLEFEMHKDRLYTAGDESGEISYKEILGEEWFRWKPYDIETAARKIYELQAGA